MEKGGREGKNNACYSMSMWVYVMKHIRVDSRLEKRSIHSCR